MFQNGLANLANFAFGDQQPGKILVQHALGSN